MSVGATDRLLDNWGINIILLRGDLMVMFTFTTRTRVIKMLHSNVCWYEYFFDEWFQAMIWNLKFCYVCTTYPYWTWENHRSITELFQYENGWMVLFWLLFVNRNKAPLNLWFYTFRFMVYTDTVYTVYYTVWIPHGVPWFLRSKPRDSWLWTYSMNLTCKMAYIIRSISSFDYLFRDIISWNYGQRNK